MKFDVWFETHAEAELTDETQCSEYIKEFNKLFKKKKNVLEYIKVYEGSVELSDAEVEKFLFTDGKTHLDVLPGYVLDWRWTAENNPVAKREKDFMMKYGYSCEDKVFYEITEEGCDYLKDNYNIFILPNSSFNYLTINKENEQKE